MKKIIILKLALMVSCATNDNHKNKIIETKFDNHSIDESICDFVYPNPLRDSTLLKLNAKYHLNTKFNHLSKDIDKAFKLMDWTHNRWKHDGKNRPTSSNPVKILEEASAGQNFRCVEYAIVLSAALNSVELPSRILGLKTKDVETVEHNAGHVVTETYLPKLEKWIFMDAQLNYIPFVNGEPLNAVEYKNAIINNRDNIVFRNINGAFSKHKTKIQIDWVGKYLFYFDTLLDSSSSSSLCQNKRRLMLVPLNENNPKYFQAKRKINNCIYTNNINDFYRKPKIK